MNVVTEKEGHASAVSCSGFSDEEVWTAVGFVAARPLESDYCDDTHRYPYSHTKHDTIDQVSLSRMTDYLKLSLAYVVELAEPMQ